MANYDTKLKPLEFRLYRSLQQNLGEEQLATSRILIGCSGGVDSIVLASVLIRLAPRLGFSVAIAHVHHGKSKDPKVTNARLRAHRHVQKFAMDQNVEFLSQRNLSGMLRSEEDLRDFRHRAFREMMSEGGFKHLALAHHADDLLETRVIRLIRGTGPSGLSAMKSVEKNGILRPLLCESRTDILTLAKSRNLKWIDDPSNSDPEPLRNWLRLVWFPMLEEKRRGGTSALARSLRAIAASLDENGEPAEAHSSQTASTKIFDEDGHLDRQSFRSLDHDQKSAVLRRYIRAQGIFKFTSSQILEVVKRLDTAANELKFKVLQVNWQINARQIKAVVSIKSRRRSSAEI
jgi:tRNA(Ile)-lysidine synthase